MLIYIHGFNSSPDSYKATLLRSYADKISIPDIIEVPTLSFDPAVAMNQLLTAVSRYQRGHEIRPLCFIGSSLGGYYATWLAEKFDHSRVVLINPVVKPLELFENHIGYNKNFYTGEEFLLDLDHVSHLKKYEVREITYPERYLLMLQTGDDVLDYNLALEKYAAVPSIVEEGGGHEFFGFDRHLDTVLAFCGINCLKEYS
ncbi:MAG TPA: esterase [Gammaproteobacteria bacterium]|nr:esterase [Gammaproteobacteria bacterium]